MSAQVRDALSIDVQLVLHARELWPRVRGQFTDPRLRDFQEDLESSAVEKVLKDKDALSHLHGAEREAALIRALRVGALDEARKTTGSKDPRVRDRIEAGSLEDLTDAGDDGESLAQADATIAAAEVLDSLNLTGDERLIAGCYAIGCQNPRDIAYAIGETVPYINERLRTLLPYMRGMLADHVAPSLDERTRELICRYAQGELAARRYWRERHNAQRLVENNSDCLRLYQAQRATDRRLGILLPLPLVLELLARGGDGGTSLTEPAAHSASVVREQISTAMGQARRHATAAYQRALDPTPLAGMRPGAATAVLASCLSIGGGAGYYCLTAGVNPVDGFKSILPHHREHRRVVKAKPIRVPELPAPRIASTPLPAPSRPRAATSTRASAPVSHASSTTSPPPPAPQDEFGPENASTSTPSTSSAPAQRATAAPRRPAPAPANGPGEFGP